MKWIPYLIAFIFIGLMVAKKISYRPATAITQTSSSWIRSFGKIFPEIKWGKLRGWLVTVAILVFIGGAFHHFFMGPDGTIRPEMITAVREGRVLHSKDFRPMYESRNLIHMEVGKYQANHRFSAYTARDEGKELAENSMELKLSFPEDVYFISTYQDLRLEPQE